MPKASLQLSWAALPCCMPSTRETDLAGILHGLSACWFLPVVALFLFIVIETRSPDPLLDFHVFASRDFTLGVIISSLAMISIYSTAYLIPFYLQGILGFSPSHAGLLLIPQAACQGIMMLVSGRVLDVKGPREIVTVGAAGFCRRGFLHFPDLLGRDHGDTADRAFAVGDG